ncbi:flagellar basal body rod C-terminal domain-containing protein [Sphingomonas sp. DG1-23]|uniref:flagellar hook-associated protein FlgK n=1 Tax=Sphingomonas sp. DG1-23 TaxID=3068316 RepID=UPI00273FC840|nr:flagellar basal body rod C-terminal domain-containing protein [Sphingomonas sp. DG1-23]MDP5280343.1 flagellar basal body rod C-terminal domain-containing protein [Sphingomonas sp. DG1-23]
MSLNHILGSAVSGLAAAQAGLRSVSNNIANVGVSGYARERVNLTTGVVSGQIAGVVVGEPSRVADRFLEANVYRRAGDYGRADVTAGYLDRLQSLLGQPGAASGLPARLDSITASAVAMTGSQSSAQTVAVFTSDVQDAIDSMQQLQTDVSGLRGDVESEVGYSVDKINSLLKRIHDLNGTVASATGQGRNVGGAADQRMSAIEELSGLIAVNVRDQPDGRVTIETANGGVLLDKKLRQLSYPNGGAGTSQPTYPNIEIRFAEDSGAMGAATGEKLDSAAVGGKLGGLLDLRDRALPAFSEQMGVLFSGLSEALNSVSNAGSTVPPPATLDGRQTGLVGGDRLGFTGAATFAVTKADGTLVAKTSVDFSAMPAGATINDMVTAINAGLGGAATASFTDGKLSIKANGAGNGVVVAQNAANPSDRAGVGVSQYFGLNDMVRSDSSSLVPPGFVASDPHGFATGETAQITLRDATGRALTSYTLTPTSGGDVGDLVSELNASPLGDFGDFSLDDRGRMRFEPTGSLSGATLSVPSDSTDRFGTGRGFAAMLGLTGASSGLENAQVRPEVLASPAKLPLARFQENAAVGAKALGAGDTRGATAFVDKLASAIDMGKDGTTTIERFSSLLLGRAGLEASQAEGNLLDASARRDDAVNRRDSFSGVNIDEELAQMVILQNSYSAAARVISTASEMYDTLLNMV